MSKDFIKSEKKIRKIINNNDEFKFNGNQYQLILCCKPTLEGSGGEVKTDFFIRAKNKLNSEIEEFKISYKQPNWAFMENKVKKEIAEKIYGPNWSSIIQSQIEDIRKKETGNFEDAYLFYAFKKKKRIYPGSFTVGWRYEIEKDSNRKLHANIIEDIAEQVYFSKGQHDRYRNALVEGEKIENSGVPNYYLEIDTKDIQDNDDIWNNIIPISHAMKGHVPCASFLAQNYDPINNKQHGGNKRDLGVVVEWYADNKMLKYEIIYDRPLTTDSNSATNRLINALHSLGVNIGKAFSINTVETLIKNKYKIKY